jgi:hypothetical protein
VTKPPSNVVSTDFTCEEQLSRKDGAAPDDESGRLDEVLFSRQKIVADGVDGLAGGVNQTTNVCIGLRGSGLSERCRDTETKRHLEREAVRIEL